MRRWILRATAFSIAFAFLAFLALWFSSSGHQGRYEAALIGRTLDEVEAFFGRKPNRYLTRDQLRRRQISCGWEAGHEAVGHWEGGRPGYQDMVVVVFDGNGKAVDVVYHSAF